MRKITWRLIAAIILSIATPLVTIYMTGTYIEEGGYLVGIPMAAVSYLLINGWTALFYALNRAFGIFIRHLTFPGFSIVGLLVTIFFIFVGFAIGLTYFVFCPIIMLLTHYSELMGDVETVDVNSNVNE